MSAAPMDPRYVPPASALTLLSREEKLALLRSRLGAGDTPGRSGRLSRAQTRLWELEQRLASNAMHVFAIAYELEGRLDANALADAIALVGARHAALHARIEQDAATHDVRFVDAPVPVMERRALLAGEDIAAVLRAESSATIQPARAAGWRSVLIERAPDAHVLLLQFHHIFADRWSVGVFVADLSHAYRARLAGEEAFASPAPRAAHDADDPAPEDLAYWRERFTPAAPRLEIPGAQRAESFSDYAGDRLVSEVGTATTAAARALGAAESTTIFPVLLAAFAGALHAHTGQDDLVVCTPMVGRHRARTRGVIGYFNNIVPVRLDLRGDPSFRELVARVAGESREAYAHQDVPFHALAALPELASARLTTCLFAVQNIPGLALDLPGIVSRYADVANGTANFDVSIFIEENGGRLEMLLDHKMNVVDAAAASTLGQHFRDVLALVLARPDMRLSELPRYSRAETPRSAPVIRSAPSGLGDEERNLLEQRVVAIWRRMFVGAEIHANSHFFDLGGDSMMAARLFDEIEYEMGHELPLASLLEAPTPRELAWRMGDDDWVRPWTSLRPVKATGTRPPLFCVSGGGGNVVIYKYLGDALDEDQPLYCLQARGLKSDEQPLRSVEAAAAHYLDAIRQLQPSGPYLLMGHSFGAAVAYEMAQRLAAAGEPAAFLGMLDHPGPNIRIDRIQWVRHHLGNMTRVTFGQVLGYVWRGIQWRALSILVARRIKAPPSAHAGAPARSLAQHLELAMRALGEYVIAPYAGPLTVFRASAGTPKMLADPQGGWAGVALGGIEMVEVPGTHDGMLQLPHVQSLGKAVSRTIAKLDLPQSSSAAGIRA